MHWNPVSNPPPQGQHCLVFSRHRGHETEMLVAEYDRGEWFTVDYFDRNTVSNVTHWMELPKEPT